MQQEDKENVNPDMVLNVNTKCTQRAKKNKAVLSISAAHHAPNPQQKQRSLFTQTAGPVAPIPSSVRRATVEAVNLADMVGATQRSGFTHLHAYLGPRAWCLLGNLSSTFAPSQRARYSVPRKARCAAYMPDIVAAAVCNDIEEAWHCLNDPSAPPSQEEIDVALQWVMLFPARQHMADLLRRHGAGVSPADRDELDQFDPQLMHDVICCESRRSHTQTPRAEDINGSLSLDVRGKIMKWLTQAGSALRFDNALIAGAILTFDRYCALYQGELEQGMLHCLALAALSLEMKASPEEASCPQRALVLEHLAQRQVTLAEIHRLEFEVLSALNCNVAGVPPTRLLWLMTRRFCDALVRLQLMDELLVRLWKMMADFLLEIAVYSTVLQYQWAPVVLAAGALGVALFTLEAETASTQSRQAVLHKALDADLAEVWQRRSADATLRSCEAALLGHWVSCAQGEGAWTKPYQYLCSKYAHRGLPAMLDSVAGVRDAAAIDDVMMPGLVQCVRNFERFHGNF